ncbi:CPP1-like family protein [Leptolyngbya ohadii]|uniref:CPP1-like family protein n=1 Tax=Leptolyngbya ohadii TaxID=1962290 RepID=UPI000B59DDF5|nr:CPP1-like family protein [Leptolyngbya ohadii]
MSDMNPYEQLGVDEDSSFDEIQSAKNRLVEACSERKQIEALEAAYDAILMDRLRLRQEGKIKVPDRIRFPEKLAEPIPPSAPVISQQTPNWLQQFLDAPSRNELLLPAGLFLAAGLLSLVMEPALPLALAICLSIYFLNRKENKFLRATLITLLGLVVGVVAGTQLANLLLPQLGSLSLTTDSFAAIVTCLILWLTASFLR